jgi:hypothetical protein
MRIFFFSVIAMVITGCTSVNVTTEQYSYARVNSGVEIIPAVIDNPVPVCNKPVQYVRLDKAPELQVYVDVKEGGVVCKSTRF